MQVLILAGGLGTRLAEETDLIPKPMVRIGGKPILLHIMKYYSSFGHVDFLISAGYKSEVIKEFFDDKNTQRDLTRGWSVEIIDTGIETGTGGRIRKLQAELDKEFMMTYGDGLSNVNLDDLAMHHQELGKVGTVTAVRPPARFGSLEHSEGLVTKFSEKNPQDAGWINGGFFYLDRGVCDYIEDDSSSFEGSPVDHLVLDQELAAYQHEGWWQPMDTLRDKRTLESIWAQGTAPWLR